MKAEQKIHQRCVKTQRRVLQYRVYKKDDLFLWVCRPYNNKFETCAPHGASITLLREVSLGQSTRGFWSDRSNWFLDTVKLQECFKLTNE